MTMAGGSDAPPTAPPPPNPPKPKGKEWWRSHVPLWGVILIALVCLLIGAASGAADDEDVVAAAGDVDELEAQLQEREQALDERDARIDELSSEVEALEQEAQQASATTTTSAPTTTTTTAPPPTTTTTPPGPVEVARYEGVVDTQTPDFVVSDAWELRWDAPGGLGCVFYVESPTGRNYGSIDSEDQPQGSSFFRDGGTYYLDVKCYGADYWNVTVVDLP